MTKYFVDAKIEIGRAYEVEAEDEEDAKRIVKENWDVDYIDEAHFKIEMDVMLAEEKTK